MSALMRSIARATASRSGSTSLGEERKTRWGPRAAPVGSSLGADVDDPAVNELAPWLPVREVAPARADLHRRKPLGEARRIVVARRNEDRDPALRIEPQEAALLAL